MSNKGYPTAAARAPSASGRLSDTAGRFAYGFGQILFDTPRPANDNRGPGIPANDNELRPKALDWRRMPIIEALKLGWYLGEFLHGWINARQKDKNQSNYYECQPTGLPYACTSGYCCGAGIPFFISCGTPFLPCPSGPVVIGSSSGMQEFHGPSAGGFFYQQRLWDFVPNRWSGTRVDLPRPLFDKPWREPEDNPEVPEAPIAPPWEDPWELPVSPSPVQWPAPPYRVIPWFAPDGPWRRTGPAANPRPRPRPGVRPAPRPGRQPGVRFRPSETPGVSFDPTGAGRPKQQEVTVRREPPGRGVKEKKPVFDSRGRRLVLKILNGVTEGIDVVDALEKSLPDECRVGARATPQAKLRALYECSDDIDFCKAVRELVENQVEDFIYGTAGEKLGKPAGRAMGRPVGPQAGPADSPGKGLFPDVKIPDKQLQEAIEELGPKAIIGDIVEAMLDELGVCN